MNHPKYLYSVETYFGTRCEGGTPKLHRAKITKVTPKQYRFTHERGAGSAFRYGSRCAHNEYASTPLEAWEHYLAHRTRASENAEKKLRNLARHCESARIGVQNNQPGMGS